MKRSVLPFSFFIPLLLLSCCQWLAAQCPTGDLIFTSQAQIDNFPLLYPNCTDVPGNVHITGNEIFNLNGLSSFLSIGGTLTIDSADALSILSGLNNLTIIHGTLRLFGNDMLLNFSGLENLVSIGGSLEILNNGGLTNLVGLGDLTHIGGDLKIGDLETTFTGHIDGINGNNNLTSLTGLENISYIGGQVVISENPALISLTYFKKLISLDSNFFIISNPALDSLIGLDSLTSVAGDLQIFGNGTLANLMGLEGLQSIEGTLSIGATIHSPHPHIIAGNANLESLNALGGITSVGAIFIGGNPQLNDLTGLHQVSSLSGSLAVAGNDNLESLSGLENITSISGSLAVFGNDSLSSLDVLSNLTSVGGSLYIGSNPTLTSLSGLQSITSVGSHLSIYNNDALVSLSGLENITMLLGVLEISGNEIITSLSGLGNISGLVTMLRISGNDSLISLSGLENITMIGESLEIVGNNSLSNLSGLDNITNIGELLWISGNLSLLDLSALEKITTIGRLDINGNEALTSLCGLKNIESIDDFLRISDNQALSACHFKGICNYFSGSPSDIIIENNAPGCNTPAEVEAACSQSSQGDHFVDDTATGAGNGTSWLDAFTDLQAALAIAQEGDEIWVAEGIYKPDTLGGNPSSTFLIDKNLRLYGGFIGSECLLTERGDPAEHPSVLSGDLNWDDVPDNFVISRADNVMTVVTVTAAVTNETVVDGFTISNGQADGPQNNHQQNGGAVYSTGSPHLRQCSFDQNYAFRAGGAISQNSNFGQSMVLENCSFEKNMAKTNGGGIAFFNGGNSSSLIVRDCAFTENSSGEAGAIMVLSQPNSNVANAYHLIEDCTFTGNTAFGNTSDGGAIFAIMRGLNMTMEILGCTFSGNQAPDMGEGTVGLWGTNNGTGSFLVDSCLFENNSSFFGAAIQCGNAWNGGSSVSRTIKNTQFIGNMAAKGGAIDLYNNGNSPMDILIEDCLFDGNAATLGGGAVSFSPGSNGFQLFLNRCEILNNESPIGGAIEGYNFGGTTLPDANIRIENCLIAENSSETSAIHLDSVSYTQIINSTIANNNSDGIQAVDKSAVFLQNTILANPGYVEYTASTNSNFTSNGGNLVLDNSLAVQLGSGDKQGLDPLFVGSGYNLQEGSPCVDTGNPDGISATTDLDGAPRIQGERVDMGAFESPFTGVNSTREILAGEVEISPNPAGDFLNIYLPEKTTVPLELQVFDAQGRLLRRQPLADGQPLDVAAFSPGMYSLKVVVGERVFVGKFIKQ